MARKRLVLATVASVFLKSALTQAQAQAQEQQICYFPDGETPSPEDVPCNSTATASACCNKSNMCMDNGLCLFNGVMSRGSCTDKNWGPDCPDFCTTTKDAGISLFPCSIWGEIFSCTWGDCSLNFPINGGNGVALRPSQVSKLGLPGALVSATDVLDVASVTATGAKGTTSPSSSSSSSSSSASVVSNDDGAKYTAGEMAGVGAGVGAPLLLALMGALFLLWRERQVGKKRQQAATAYEPIQQQQASSITYGNPSPPMTQTYGGGPKQSGQMFHEELDNTNTQCEEMPVTGERQELPGATQR